MIAFATPSQNATHHAAAVMRPTDLSFRNSRSNVVGTGQLRQRRAMRAAGVRLQAPVARLLSEVLEGEGYPATAARIADAIERQATTEAPLTAADYEAILDALNRNCPATLYRLRRELLEDQRSIRRVTGG